MSDTQQLLTPDGFNKLKEELNKLLQRRKEVSHRIELAKEQGDLSENAEYSEAKEEQGFVEGRILEIEELLRSSVVVQKNTSNHETIELGTTIDVKDGNGILTKFTIVSVNEAEPAKGCISNESPLGQALISHREGDSVNINVPSGIKKFTIVKIY